MIGISARPTTLPCRQGRSASLEALRSASPRLTLASSRATGGSSEPTVQDSRNMLEAFFIGRAFAEILNERLGAKLGDALAAFGKWDAETRQSIREFQDEVAARAQREMLAAAGAPELSSSGGSSGSARSSGVGTSELDIAAAAHSDLAALVDDLRAEVASTRAVLQQLKLKQQRQQQQGRQF